MSCSNRTRRSSTSATSSCCSTPAWARQSVRPDHRPLQKSIAEAGIKPGDIDAVVCSHAHIDHIGGIVGDDGKPLFPNAQFYIAQSDFDYWTDEGKSAAR